MVDNTYEWLGYEGNTYPASRLADFCREAFENAEIIRKSRGVWYYNIPCSFDIETSSFYAVNKDNEKIKQATMYIWQMGINGSVIYGRTWEEWGTLLQYLEDTYKIGYKKRLVIYVHNLGYEFQFIRKWFNWDKVFAIKQRRPVYAISGGFEFRCSLFLSNYALAYIGDNLLHKYPVKKLVGNLDYDKVRHSKTPLTDDELAYCINDVRVVMSYIQEKIEEDGDITKIPLTNTGYVRNYCREECFFRDCKTEKEKRKATLAYRALMKQLQIKDEEEYKQLKRAFMGGFTHASCLYSGQIVEDVGSADLTSSYPYVMVAEYFPMSKGQYIGAVEDVKLFKYYLENFCCIFDIVFYELMPITEFEHPLSLSRCEVNGKSQINNGRVVYADVCKTTLTELDFDTVDKFYTWDSLKILNLRVYRRNYLPRPLIEAILNLYKNKTSLKGISDRATEYLVSKNMINSAFGMMVTNIVRDEYVYNEDDWAKLAGEPASQLAKYNKSFNRFLYYAWGVWVTAHARHNLFSAIYEFGIDYVYADTDSIKGINFDSHMKYFKRYNDEVFNKLLKMCNTMGFKFEMCRPKTKEGVEKLIGVWDFERPYKRFKTCGAKRYIYEYNDGSLSLTVSGLNKKFAIPYLLKEYGDNEKVMMVFGEGMFIPGEHTGKMTVTYLDDGCDGFVVDYTGVAGEYHEKSAVFMEKQSYLMSILEDYKNFIMGVQYVEY